MSAVGVKMEVEDGASATASELVRSEQHGTITGCFREPKREHRNGKMRAPNYRGCYLTSIYGWVG